MKKRSLFAAVAMLIVSALVLTSATYAWFTAGGAATVGAITGNVMESGKGVMVKTTVSGAQWTGTLAGSAFTGANDHLIMNNNGQTYHPVSSADGVNFCAYTLNSNAFAADEGTISNYYDVAEFYLGVVTAGDTVNATCTYQSNTQALGAARSVLLKQNGDGWDLVAFWSGANESEPKAINYESTLTGVVDNGDFYLTDADTGYLASYLLSQGITKTSGQSIAITGVPQFETSTQLYRAVTWIEGNDAGCTPSTLSGDDLSTTWTFSVPAQQGG
jgi:hypothetical protein